MLGGWERSGAFRTPRNRDTMPIRMKRRTTAPKSVRQFFQKMGKKGGKISQAQRTKEERSESGRKAVNARWAKYRAAKQESGSEE